MNFWHSFFGLILEKTNKVLDILCNIYSYIYLTRIEVKQFLDFIIVVHVLICDRHYMDETGMTSSETAHLRAIVCFYQLLHFLFDTLAAYTVAHGKVLILKRKINVETTSIALRQLFQVNTDDLYKTPTQYSIYQISNTNHEIQSKRLLLPKKKP